MVMKREKGHQYSQKHIQQDCTHQRELASQLVNLLQSGCGFFEIYFSWWSKNGHLSLTQY